MELWSGIDHIHGYNIHYTPFLHNVFINITWVRLEVLTFHISLMLQGFTAKIEVFSGGTPVYTVAPETSLSEADFLP